MCLKITFTLSDKINLKEPNLYYCHTFQHFAIFILQTIITSGVFLDTIETSITFISGRR